MTSGWAFVELHDPIPWRLWIDRAHAFRTSDSDGESVPDSEPTLIAAVRYTVGSSSRGGGMLKIIRAYVCQKFGDVEKLSSSTGVSVDDLRSFAFGKATLTGFELDQLAIYFKLEVVPQRQPLLPCERVESDGIQEDYAKHFDLARDALLFGLSIIGSNADRGGRLPNIQKPHALSWPVVHLSLGIYTKIMKQARAIIALCELGLVKDAGAIERCMFESMLALQYILQSRVKIKENGVEISKVKVQCGKPDKNGNYPPKKERKVRPLTSKMRALLYHARDCIRAEEELDDYKNINRQDLVDALGDEKAIRELSKIAKGAIGSAWAQRQKQAGSYAGVKIKDLAQSYGLLDHYLSIYHRQSKTVHGTDGNDFFDIADGLKLDIGPSPVNVEAVLFLAATMVVGAAEVLDGRLGLGFKSEIKRRLRELKKIGEEE